MRSSQPPFRAPTEAQGRGDRFSCHLDHQQPGANDNASGCATILEVGRTLQNYSTKGNSRARAAPCGSCFRPKSRARWPLLNAKPELAKRIKAVVHMDMVGGGPETKAVFHVTRGPMSLPSFVHDVAWAFAELSTRSPTSTRPRAKAAYPSAVTRRRQGASARGIFALHHGQRPRRLSGLFLRHPGDLS